MIIMCLSCMFDSKTHYAHIITHPAHTHRQTMDRLKILLTEEGINFTDTTFNTEDGIRGLGEQPFVSKIVHVNKHATIIPQI